MLNTMSGTEKNLYKYEMNDNELDCRGQNLCTNSLHSFIWLKYPSHVYIYILSDI